MWTHEQLLFAPGVASSTFVFEKRGATLRLVAWWNHPTDGFKCHATPTCLWREAASQPQSATDVQAVNTIQPLSRKFRMPHPRERQHSWSFAISCVVDQSRGAHDERRQVQLCGGDQRQGETHARATRAIPSACAQVSVARRSSRGRSVAAERSVLRPTTMVAVSIPQRRVLSQSRDNECCLNRTTTCVVVLTPDTSRPTAGARRCALRASGCADAPTRASSIGSAG